MQSVGRPTADPGVKSLILAWSHTFVEIDNEIISTVILLQLIQEGLLSITSEISPASLHCCPWARHIYPSLILVQPRKTRPCLTERLLMGRKESNQTNKTSEIVCTKYWLTAKSSLPRECSGSVIECLTQDHEAGGLSLTGVTSLCPWARHINPSLVLVQPRKTCPYITERLLIGRKESNQTKKQTLEEKCG